MPQSKHPAWPALKAAFPHTIPILAGFGFLGLTYGIYVRVQGFSFWYAMLTGVIIFGGSLQFVAIDMLCAPFAPLQTFFGRTVNPRSPSVLRTGNAGQSLR